MNIYAVQVFPKNRWQTVNLSTDLGQAYDKYDAATNASTLPIRLVSFAVDNFDFIATHCKDFKVHERTP